MSTGTLLADRIEIADLFSRFARLLDEKRWDDAGRVFTEDVTGHSPRSGEIRGLAALVAFMRQAEVEGERTQHVTTDLLVDVDGDRAAAAANSLVLLPRRPGPPRDQRPAPGRHRGTDAGGLAAQRDANRARLDARAVS